MSSKHNYTNPAFCQGSEFYPRNTNDFTASVEAIYNRSLNASTYATRNVVGPLRMQRSMSTRSVRGTKMQKLTQTQKSNATSHVQPSNPQLNRTVDAFDAARTGSGRYALVPVEELATSTIGLNSCYAIVPGEKLLNAKRYAKSQEHLERYDSHVGLANGVEDEPHSYHEHTSEQPFMSLPPMLNYEQQQPAKKPIAPQTRQQNTPAHRRPPPTTPPKIKHAFSSDFGSKSFLIVDKNSNQRYQMVPTAEDEELVDENQEVIQMHNGRPHRYAVIPTEQDDDVEDDEVDENDDEDFMHNDDDEAGEQETCLSSTDLHQSQNFLAFNYKQEHQQQQQLQRPPQQRATPMRTSTPQRGNSMVSLTPTTPLRAEKNPQATKMLHELITTPRKLTPNPRSVQTTPRKNPLHQQQQQQFQLQQRTMRHQSQQQIYYTPQAPAAKKELSPQRLHYETVKKSSTHTDRTMAVIQPRVAANGTKVHPQMIAEEEDCSSIHAKSFTDNSYPQKVANATITLAVVSLMLVVGSAMNSALIIYMIAHFGKSFYLQFSLIAAFSGVGLGFLGFRSRHCEWLPNRSYTSGYILVTMFCLLKCCGLLVILVLDPFPGLPLHDVTTGIILGLSTFTIFFIGLGVIGSLWCYRPPPDNRVNVA